MNTARHHHRPRPITSETAIIGGRRALCVGISTIFLHGEEVTSVSVRIRRDEHPDGTMMGLTADNVRDVVTQLRRAYREAFGRDLDA